MHRTGFKHDAAQNRNATHTCVQICHLFFVFFLMVREVCALFGCCQVHYSGFASTSSPPGCCGFGRGSAGVVLLIYFSLVFRSEHDSVAVLKVCQTEPTCVPVTSDRVPANTKRIQLKAQEKVADDTEFPAVPPREERRLLQSTGLARVILRRSCEGVAVDTSLSLNPLGESACGSMAALHQHTLLVIYLFFLFFFFSPDSRTMEFRLRKCQTRAGRCVSPPVCPVHGYI